MSPAGPRNAGVRALRSLGAGVDGAAFVGQDALGRACTVHRLRAEIAEDPQRRRRLLRRIAFHQQAELEQVPGLLAVRTVALNENPSVVVVEHATACLVDEACLQGAVLGPAFVRTVRLLLDLAQVLALAHTEGIVHGGLTPQSVRVRGKGVALSFLGLRTLEDGQPDAFAQLLSPKAEESGAVDDAFAFGALILFLAIGQSGAKALLDPRSASTLARDPSANHPLVLLARDLLDVEPAWRPTLADCGRRLAALAASADAPATLSSANGSNIGTVRPTSTMSEEGPDSSDHPPRIGRFRLVAELGRGAMGRVYRGVDEDSGAMVAVKLLQQPALPPKKALRRFRKEARLLAELHNPGVARYLDAGEDKGVLYLVTELVEGQNLSALIKSRGTFAEREAIALIVDLLQALIDVHDRGIVHRDLKPENLIVVDVVAPPDSGTRVKLIDFGIARHFDESESLALTREGAVLGTPLYMAPEQARGGVVDARTDLYAVGTTLFELLVGRAPFAGKGIAAVLALQLEEVPPRACALRSDVSNDVSRIIARCLEKDPALRFQSARELRQALAPLVEAPAAAAWPQTPATGPSGRQGWTFTWDLASSPSALWPYVSNTERLNKAIGVPAVNESVVVTGGDVVRVGNARQAGFALAWRENPYEWVYERRLGVLREYQEGPLRWYSSTLDLSPHEVRGRAGTRLVQRIELEPRGLLGRAASSIEVGVRTRRALERTYQRIDELLQGRLGDAAVLDAFEQTPGLPVDKEARLAWLEKQSVAAGADAATIARLGDWLRQASPQHLARIRPVALARRLGLNDDVTIKACFHAAGTGLLVPLWDLLCPICRVPAAMEDTLKALKDHAHCEVCDVDFPLDLATSIELVFKLDPALRAADAQTYCISSPAHTPHVMAQVRLAKKTSFVVDASLPEGSYQLVGRRLSFAAAFRVQGQAASTQWSIALSRGPGPDDARAFSLGRQRIELMNDTDREQLVRIERTTPRDDVVTAARALASPLFRRLFPGEVLAPGALVRVAAMTVLLAEVDGGDDERGFEKRYGLFRVLEKEIVDSGGTVVRLQGDGVLAVFHEPATALRCALALPAVIAGLAATTVRCAIHRGPAAAVSLNEHVDYFGGVVSEVLQLAKKARVGELVLSDAVRGDPAVDAILVKAQVKNPPDATLDDVGHRLQLPATVR